MNILLTSCSAGLKKFEAEYFVKKSKFKDKIKVYGCDNNPTKNNMYEKIFKVPMGDSKDYINRLYEIVDQYGIRFIIPSSDEEALTLSKNRKNLLELKCIPLCSNYDVLELINNKAKTYDICKFNKIPIADFRVVKNMDELISAINHFRDNYNDFVLKPNDDRGSRGIYAISKNRIKTEKIGRELHISFDEFYKNIGLYFKNFKDYIVMEMLQTPCHDVDVLCDNGVLVEMIIRKRINSIFPNEGHEIISNVDLYNEVKKICKIFNLNYLHDLDFMPDENGKLKLIEINPRISGSTIISCVLGYKVFDNLIALAQNQYNFDHIGKLGKILPINLEKFFESKY
tara:strand:- start:109 stop:1134 length:1026 start_codon:yes stop_codon:yes gene_type:complete